MTRHMTLKALLVGFVAWACFDLSATSPTFAAIAHVNGSNVPVAGLPTVTILDQTGRDISATWLPEPGQAVTIQVDGATVNSLSLVGTTAYPGICTNFGTGTSPDFTLSGTQLTSNDCGGKTQLVANTTSGTFTFTLPQDSDNDGLPDVWETQNLVANADDELSPSVTDATNPQGTAARRGDGLAVLDEYRGFIVSDADNDAGSGTPTLQAGTKHIRTDPLQKDFFIHVVNNQCAPATPPAVHGTFARYFPANGTNMFTPLYTMIPGAHVHLLDYVAGAANPVRSTLWEDFFEYFSATTPAGQTLNGLVFRTAGNVLTNAENLVPTDRQINRNAWFPITDQQTGLPVQKGIRLIECQVVDTLTTLGVNDWGTPNKAGSAFAVKAGNAVVYTERVRRDIQTKLTNAGLRQIRWAVYVAATPPSTGGQWTVQSPNLTANQNQGTQDFLATKQLQYLVAHEIGHATQLRPTSTNGYHSTTGSGSMMDATLQVTQESQNTATKKTTFNIPSEFRTSDQIEIKFKN